jgi:hypothetical protein
MYGLTYVRLVKTVALSTLKICYFIYCTVRTVAGTVVLVKNLVFWNCN